MKLLAALLACVCVLAACSKSSSKSTTTETIGNSVPKVPLPTTPAAPIGPSACSLVTSAQATTLLGSPATGVESDPQAPVYKTCNWETTPAAAARATKVPPFKPGTAGVVLVLGLIRIGNGEVGFAGSSIVGLGATVVAGLGNAATYSSGTSPSGIHERLLVTKKGTVSMSLSLLYGKTVTPPSSIQHDLTAVARAVFAELHA
jgi:hypothetical protein